MSFKILKILIFSTFLISCTTTTNKLAEPKLAKFNQPVILKVESNDIYRHIQKAFGPVPETPDCSHKNFGPHITQSIDSELGQKVFVFHLHVKEDSDRCLKADRQRLEIKTVGDASTPSYLKGFDGDTVSFRWKFKLSSKFQAAYSFTHLHQLKAYDGDDDMRSKPLI